MPVPGRSHLEHLTPCPFLPVPESPLGAEATKNFCSSDRGEAFYRSALLYAQSLWLQGFPAKALLLVNRALGADLDGTEAVLDEWPLPYPAAAWLMRSRRADQFIGNPRRHYQHLATRMVEPRKETRTWRAWACWHLSNLVFPAETYPSDEKQIKEEGVVLPGRDHIFRRVAELGITGETASLEKAEVVAEGGPGLD